MPLIALAAALGSLLLSGTPELSLPGATVMPVHGELVFEGLPMRLWVQETHEGAPEVLAFYIRTFEAAGLKTDRNPRLLPPFLGVTGLDPRDKVVHLVLAAPHQGGCTVITGHAEVGRLAAVGGALFGVPLFPGAQGVTGARIPLAEEPGAANILYSVPVPAEEVVAFYREVTNREGYAFQAGAEAGHFALGRPGSARWEVEVHERAQGTSKSTLVMLHELGAPR